MQDPYGRTIDYLRLSVTDRCNLRCRYCMPEDGVEALAHGEILSYEELLRIAAAAVRLGVRKIRVTGGEPLVRRGLCGFIAALASLPGAPEIVLTTNGLLLGDRAVELRAAGLARVNVSLDTLQPERFRVMTRRDGLDKVLAGLAAAEAAGLTPLKLNMVPIAGVNADEIPAFAALTRQHPWDVRFIEYMPVSAGVDYPSSSRLPAAEIFAALVALGPLAEQPAQPTAGPARMFRLPGHLGRIGVIPAVSQHFCAGCNRLRLTADGRIRLCLLSGEEVDLREALRAGLTDSELEGALRRAVASKPAGHRLEDAAFAPTGRRMHGIGG